jgi:hypothetical protein
LPRRSTGDIAAVVDQIAALLLEHTEVLRADQIRAKLGLAANELPRPLKDGLAAGRFTKSGEKRATTYRAKAAAPPRGSKASRARKPAAPSPAVDPAPSPEKSDPSADAGKKPRGRPSLRARPADGGESVDAIPEVTPPTVAQDS